MFVPGRGSEALRLYTARTICVCVRCVRLFPQPKQPHAGRRSKRVSVWEVSNYCRARSTELQTCSYLLLHMKTLAKDCCYFYPRSCIQLQQTYYSYFRYFLSIDCQLISLPGSLHFETLIPASIRPLVSPDLIFELWPFYLDSLPSKPNQMIAHLYRCCFRAYQRRI